MVARVKDSIATQKALAVGTIYQEDSQVNNEIGLIIALEAICKAYIQTQLDNFAARIIVNKRRSYLIKCGKK